ncbi:MAG: SixA phosphatase family protein [Ilumatobacteraceae bacterium]
MAASYLVRHAKAGRRHDWKGDDRARPLSGPGRRQSEAIAKRLDDVLVTSLWSSPYRRCVETLEPLGERTGLTVASDDRLAEGARLEDAMALLREGGDGAVLCSHGDVVPDVVEALIRRGAKLTSDPDWRKASIWVLELDADGTVLTVRADPPPS